MLDRKKPFGEVFGPHPHRYEQDGKCFDHEGVEIGVKTKADKAKPAKAQEPAVEAEVNPQLSAQLSE